MYVGIFQLIKMIYQCRRQKKVKLLSALSQSMEMKLNFPAALQICIRKFIKIFWVVAVFVVEKLVYFVTWIVWISQHGSELSAIFDRSPLTGTFFAIYGPNDLLFGLFFAWVFLETRRS